MKRLPLVLAMIAAVLVSAAADAQASRPTISIKNAARYEPRHDGAMTFTVQLSAPSNRQVRVSWATSDGTAIAGDDYTASSGILVFKPGVTRNKVVVPTLADGIDEDDESFTVTLSSPVRATIAHGVATGTIWDADPPPSVSVGDVSALEGNAGSKDVTIPLTLSAPSSFTVSFTLDSAGTSATEGVDFDSSSEGVWTFAPGETSKSAHFTIYGDTDVEPDESWTVTLSAPINAALGDAIGGGLIVNDD
jgi:hypothetical protein